MTFGGVREIFRISGTVKLFSHTQLESKLTNELQYDDIIDKFAHQQVRKKL